MKLLRLLFALLLVFQVVGAVAPNQAMVTKSVGDLQGAAANPFLRGGSSFHPKEPEHRVLVFGIWDAIGDFLRRILNILF